MRVVVKKNVAENLSLNYMYKAYMKHKFISNVNMDPVLKMYCYTCSNISKYKGKIEIQTISGPKYFR